MFQVFYSKLVNRFQKPLPGKTAQDTMKPYLKISKKLDVPTPFNAKKSAVFALLYPIQDIPHVLLIERNDYKGAHSGQLAFPGGKIEKNDASSIDTAFRETFEEIGVHKEQIEVIGRLTDLYVLASNFIVYPYVGILQQRPDVVLDKREVKQILEISIPFLLHEVSTGEKKMKSALGMTLNAPYYDIHGKTLWGATAMMVSELLWMIRESGYH